MPVSLPVPEGLKATPAFFAALSAASKAPCRVLKSFTKADVLSLKALVLSVAAFLAIFTLSSIFSAISSKAGSIAFVIGTATTAKAAARA